MRPPRNPPPMPAQAYADNRRRHGRLRCEDLRCPLGTVQDLSASGMRVLHKGRMAGDAGDRFPITLSCDAGTEVHLNAEIVRVEKIGFRRYSYGLKFVDVDEETHALLIELVRNTASKTLLV